ncbi:hypothetical protein BC629DRAFT_292657 [Irpex lacteus]|nr:hypothetical protein BC629DRAFT_292657 [Irpex lacteus]
MEAHRPTLSENSAPQFISDSLQPTQIGSARIRLPNEIVDLIIQECWLDWDSRHKVLRECSLVSRKWRAMVIPYLFREITINPSGHTTSAYAQFLLDTPLIASRIRSVHIRRAPFTVPELIPLLERLPGLRSLRLYQDLKDRRYASDSPGSFRIGGSSCPCGVSKCRWQDSSPGTLLPSRATRDHICLPTPIQYGRRAQPHLSVLLCSWRKYAE